MPAHKKLAEAAEAYLKTWEHHDVEAMAHFLHDEFRFKEPLAEITGRQSFLAFAEKNVHLVKEVSIRSRFESETAAVVIYDFVFVDPIGSQNTIAHFIFDDGRIRSIELFYDPRRLERMMARAS